MNKARQIRLLRKRCDRALSLYVRAWTKQRYGKCPLCGVNEIQACFHFIRKRAVPWLRWRLDNVIGSCHRCNWIEYRNPDPSRAWYIREYGITNYLKLVDAAMKRSPVPGEKKLLGLIAFYEERLESLKDA